ncbi:hypothetical protein J6590_082556 [Homalodisca vitripennis]|nr:hypothetical protein J6590_082556 [Homalodisca vitripennis]
MEGPSRLNEHRGKAGVSADIPRTIKDSNGVIVRDPKDVSNLFNDFSLMCRMQVHLPHRCLFFNKNQVQGCLHFSFHLFLNWKYLTSSDL